MADADLPDECWEHVFKFLTSKDNNDSDNERDYKLVMKSLSVVSKEFLSITNRLRYSLTIHTQRRDRLYERLPILFQRFSNITSLDLSRYRIITGHPSYEDDLYNILVQISQFPLKLTSFTFSRSCTIPTNGLRAFSQKITTLTSLTCSNIGSINSTDIFFLADCFPLLEELDLSYSYSYFSYSYFRDCTSIPSIVEPLSLALFKLRKVNLSGHDYINDKLLFHLFKNCKLLEEVSLFHCLQLTDAGIASALLERPTLKSLSFGTLQDWTMLSAFTRNCPSLSEMKVQHCMRRVNNVENFNSFVVSPQLKSLRFCLQLLVNKRNHQSVCFIPQFGAA
jgi:F-box/leucine-rich repeat protein 2/20